MNRDLVVAALTCPGETAVLKLLDDETAVFWVDWREDDAAIVEFCESILQTGSLAVESRLTGRRADWTFCIVYKGVRTPVPLVYGPEDRHITIVTLNRALVADFEIRLCIDSEGADTLAFLPLPSATWEDLEREYGHSVSQRFYRLRDKPNVFTDTVEF